MKLSDLQLNNGQLEGLPANPRYIEAEDFEQLKLRLLRMPQYLRHNPIKVEENNIILGGNMRYRALQALAEEHAVGRWTDKNGVEHTHNFTQEIPDEWVVQLTDYTLEDKRRIVLLDNAQNGKDDLERLANEWSEAEINDWGNGVPEEWEEITKEDVKSEDDDFDEETDLVEARCSLGDIWLLGEHRLMCGDSTKAEDVARLMDGDLAQLVITDPPYNVAIGSKNKFLTEHGFGGGIQEDIENDKGMTDEEIGEKIWAPAFKNLCDFATDDCAIYVSMPQGGTHMMMMMMMSRYWQVKHELIWLKNAPTFSMGRLNYDYKHEPIVYGWKKKHNWYAKEPKQSILCFDKPKKCDLHPTMKPIALWAELICNSSQEGMIVSDFFGGSGTTIVACEQLHRKARLMELNPHYCDVIIARWEKLTGKEAVKL